MSAQAGESEPAYHLLLEAAEIPLTARALRLLISDEAHQPQIRRLGREVLAELEQKPEAGSTLSVALTPGQMKITHSALRLLLNDVRRDQAQELVMLQGILEKLPDEHSIRAITID